MEYSSITHCNLPSSLKQKTECWALVLYKWLRWFTEHHLWPNLHLILTVALTLALKRCAFLTFLAQPLFINNKNWHIQNTAQYKYCMKYKKQHNTLYFKQPPPMGQHLLQSIKKFLLHTNGTIFREQFLLDIIICAFIYHTSPCLYLTYKFSGYSISVAV